MQPSSAAAVELPIGARNAFHIIPRNRNGDDEYPPFRSAPPGLAKKLAGAALALRFGLNLVRNCSRAQPDAPSRALACGWVAHPTDRGATRELGSGCVTPLARNWLTRSLRNRLRSESLRQRARYARSPRRGA